MLTGRGDLECSLGLGLASDVGEVGIAVVA